MAEFVPPTLPTLVQRFFVDDLRQQRAVSAQTISAYRDTLRLLLTYAASKLNRTPSAVALPDLDALMLLAFLDHLEKDRGNSARSRNARLAAIGTFLRFASHHDVASLATIERALAILLKRFDRPMVGFLSRAEIGAIIDAPDRGSWAGQRDRAFFSMMYNTGARVSEMIGIRCRDVVLEGQPAVHLLGKGRKERSVPIWRPTAALIKSWRRRIGDPTGDSILFPSRSGWRMARSNRRSATVQLGQSKRRTNCVLNEQRRHRSLTAQITTPTTPDSRHRHVGSFTAYAEDGTSLDHSTIYRWVQRSAPEMVKRLRWYWKRPSMWRSGETDIKVKGRWTFLYRAVDKGGDTIHLYLANTPSQGGEALPWEGVERIEGVGAADDYQHGHGADVWSADHGARAVSVHSGS